jgi:hypothetical protein
MLTTIALSEADAQYLARIREDCVTWLGSASELLDLRCEGSDNAIRLVAVFRVGSRGWETAAVAETLFAAHAALREAILVDRIRLGLSELVDRR